MAAKNLALLCLIVASASAKSFYGNSPYYSYSGSFTAARPTYYGQHGFYSHPAVPTAHVAYAQPAPVAQPIVKAAPVVQTVVEPVAPVAPSIVQPAAHHVNAVAAAVHEPVVAEPAPVHATQYHAQDEFGNVEYGYSNPNSAKQESRDAYGNVVGAYSYVDATGIPKHVKYVADDYGFRVVGANNLPLGPAETPEVAYARAAHFDALRAVGH